MAVIGLGYVGLPVALAFGRRFREVVGFDIDERRIGALREGRDDTGEASTDELRESAISFTSSVADIADATFYVVAVPTPVDVNRRPDLGALLGACELVGSVLTKGDIVVFESTVYPGVTEDICGPKLAEVSGLTQGEDFRLAYSPERINPGDKDHTLDRVVKVVAGEDEETLNVVAEAYGAIVKAGVHRAPSIMVAEAAKVIENTQRDVNIALMNEFALIFDRLGIRTKDVLEAAATKWNFLPFVPGLVGGHCIGVDPYYLTTKAEELGYHPEVILAGRRINDNMGRYVATRLVKMVAQGSGLVSKARVACLGLAFKENIPDLRNSRVPDIVSELRAYGVEPLVHDPHVDVGEAHRAYDIALCEWSQLADLDAVILAVPHREYLEKPLEELLSGLRSGGVVVDVRSVLDPAQLGDSYRYWSL